MVREISLWLCSTTYKSLSAPLICMASMIQLWYTCYCILYSGKLSRKCHLTLQKKLSRFLLSCVTGASTNIKTFAVLIFAVMGPSVKSAKVCTMRKFPAIQYCIQILKYCSSTITHVMTYCTLYKSMLYLHVLEQFPRMHYYRVR